MTVLSWPRLDGPIVCLLLGDRSPASVERCQRYADELCALGGRTVAWRLTGGDHGLVAAGYDIGLFFGVGDGPVERRIRDALQACGGLALADSDSLLGGCGPLLEPSEILERWSARQPAALVPPAPGGASWRLAVLLAEPRPHDPWQGAVVRLAEELVGLGHAVTLHFAVGPSLARAGDAALAALVRYQFGARRVAAQRGWGLADVHAVLATDGPTAAYAQTCSGAGYRLLLHDGSPTTNSLCSWLGLSSVIIGPTAAPGDDGALNEPRLRLMASDQGAAADLISWLAAQSPTRPSLAGWPAVAEVHLDRLRNPAPGAGWPLGADQTVWFALQPEHDGLFRVDLKLSSSGAASRGRLVLGLREHWTAPEALAVATVPCRDITPGLWTSFEFPALEAVAGQRLYASLTLLGAAPDAQLELELAEPGCEPTPEGLAPAELGCHPGPSGPTAVGPAMHPAPSEPFAGGPGWHPGPSEPTAVGPAMHPPPSEPSAGGPGRDPGPSGPTAVGPAMHPAPSEPSAGGPGPVVVRPACRLYVLEPAGRYGSLAGVVLSEWLESEEVVLRRREAVWRLFRASAEHRLLAVWWWLTGRLLPEGYHCWPADAAWGRRLVLALRFHGPRAALAALRGSR